VKSQAPLRVKEQRFKGDRTVSQIISDDIDIHESAVLAERGCLGSLLTFPDLWQHCASLTAADFLLSAHRQIWEALCRLHRDERPADLHFVANELNDKDVAIYSAGLVDGVIPDDIRRYVREVKSRAALRRAQHQIEQLPSIHSVTELRSHLALISEILDEGDAR
jgi:replicative DNA helicase